MSQKRPSKARIPILVAWIVNAVTQALPENPGTAEIRNEWGGNIPDEIEALKIQRFHRHIPTSFVTPRAAWIRTLNVEWLQRIIDTKATRLPGYLSACDEVWLLMVEEQTGLATTVEIPEALWSQKIAHRGFTKVYFLRRQTEFHEFADLK